MSYQNGFIQGITAKSTNAKKKKPNKYKKQKTTTTNDPRKVIKTVNI